MRLCCRSAPVSSAHRELLVAELPARYLVQPPLVVDSSVLCALLFDEPERGDALARLAGHHLYAPQLLDHEVLSVALKKLRHGMAADAVEQALASHLAQELTLVPPDLAAQFALARQYQLTAYDAAYLWLAAALPAPLATFDKKLADAARLHLQSLG